MNLTYSFYFVDFNYTPFLKQLPDHAAGDILDNITFNIIHSELNESLIIFGYGTETGDDYLRLENQGGDFLENIK
ncbi:MAG: hypothetical protein ACJAUQ_001810 [Maribacter sp.]